jgi:hypothetical protein
MTLATQTFPANGRWFPEAQRRARRRCWTRWMHTTRVWVRRVQVQMLPSVWTCAL